MEQLEKKKACVLFRSIVEAAEELETSEALELLLNYAHLGLGDEVDLDKCSKTVRLILKQNVECLGAAERRYEAAKKNGPKGKENGGGVGRPRKGETPEEYQKRVEEWRQSKNPQKTPNNPDRVFTSDNLDNPQKTPENNPVKNLVIPKSVSDSFQNPEKPLEVEEEVYTEVEKEKEVDIEKEIEYEFSKEEFDNILKETSYKFIRKHPDYNYFLDVDSFKNNYYDNVFGFQRYLNEQLKTDLPLEIYCELIIEHAKTYQETI